MDEVWKDLTLSSLLHHTTTNPSALAPPPPTPPPLIQQFLPYPITLATSSKSNVNPLLSPNTCLCPHYGEKREVNENVVDRKRKRLMKNRESAARSRARRQAYTYELEAEVAQLIEENAKLRKQVEKLQVEAPGLDQNPKKQKLYRSLSSPI